MKQSIEQSKY